MKMDQTGPDVTTTAGPALYGWILPVISTSRKASDASVPHQDTEAFDNMPKRSTWRITLILVALFLSLFVAALDVTIVATAIPTITNELNSAVGYTWIGGAYLLANCATGPIWATLSDVWGRKPILLASIIVFTLGSLICAVARNMPTLIVGRAVQGSAGGAMIMLVHICISDIFSVRQRSLVIGLTEGVWAFPGGIGPILGGVFSSLVSWRWCFWINLPLCAVAFILTLLFLDIKHEHTSFIAGVKAIDWFGIVTFLGSTLALLIGLDLGGAVVPWGSPTVIALLVVGSALAVLFVYGEARIAKFPLMPLHLFRQRSNVGSLLLTLFHGIVFMNAEYNLPLFFQSVLHKTPLVSGLYLLPFVLSSTGAGIVCGFVIHRTGRFCEPIWVGSFLLCLGSGLFLTWGVGTKAATLVGVQILFGIGSGLLFEPPLIAIQSQVSQQETAMATSTFTFARNVGISLSVVVGASVFHNSMDHQSGALIRAGLPENAIERLSGKNAAANVMILDALSNSAQILAVKKAFAWSMRNMYILYAVIAFCALLSGLLIKKSHLASEHTETVTGIRADVTEIRTQFVEKS